MAKWPGWLICYLIAIGEGVRAFRRNWHFSARSGPKKCLFSEGFSNFWRLGPSWGRLGTALGFRGGHRGRFCRNTRKHVYFEKRPLGGLLGPLGGLLGGPRGAKKALKTRGNLLFSRSGPSWGPLGSSWGPLGPSSAASGPLVAVLGSFPSFRVPFLVFSRVCGSASGGQQT